MSSSRLDNIGLIIAITLGLTVSIYVVHEYFIYDPIHGIAYLHVLYNGHLYWISFPYKLGLLPFLGIATLGRVLNAISADWLYYHASGLTITLAVLCIVKIIWRGVVSSRKLFATILLFLAANHFYTLLFGGKTHVIALSYVILFLYLLRKMRYPDYTYSRIVIILILLVSSIIFSYPLYLALVLCALAIEILSKRMIRARESIIYKSKYVYILVVLLCCVGIYLTLYSVELLKGALEIIISKHAVQSSMLPYIEYWIFRSKISPYVLYRLLHMTLVAVLFIFIFIRRLFCQRVNKVICLISLIPCIFLLACAFSLKPVPILHGIFTIIGGFLAATFAKRLLSSGRKSVYIVVPVALALYALNVVSCTAISTLYGPKYVDPLVKCKPTVVGQIFTRIDFDNYEIITLRPHLLTYKLLLYNPQLLSRARFLWHELWWSNPEATFNWLLDKLKCRRCIFVYDLLIDSSLEVIKQVRPKRYTIFARIFYTDLHAFNMYVSTPFLKLYGSE